MPARPTLLAAACLTVLVVAQGCASGAPAVEEAAPASGSSVVLVSIDGFRYDYFDRTDVETPTFRQLLEGGLRAERLVPVYPTKTFPNHYSLVTGLHPEAHGIVGNSMRDPDRLLDGAPAEFSLSNRDAVTDGAWWGGEPIWVTAERQGVTAATAFWPGSEAEIGGVRPTHWLVYDGDMAYADRVDQALAWLDGADRPGLVTLYFEGVDTAGHRFGPEAEETAAAIEAVDAALGRLVDGLAARGLLASTDLVIVSDHGMTSVSPERRVVIDEAVDVDSLEAVYWGEPVGIWPGEVEVDGLVARLDALPHVEAYRREDTPERLQYRDNGRIPPVVLIADEGWTVTSQDYVDRYPDRPTGGAHGFDNQFASMHGVFLAAGPSVRAGETGPLATVDVYGVLARMLGVDPAPNAGDPEAADRVLR